MHTLRNLLLFPGLLALACPLAAQVGFQLDLQPDGKTYTLSVRSQTALLPPMDNLLTGAEAVVVVPAGGLQLANLQSHVGQWELGHLIQQPSERSGADYAVFRLVGTATDGVFPQGQSVPLFSFENALGCTGNFELMDPLNDPFLPPNSLGLDIGQSFFAEGTTGNAYLENLAPGSADCTRLADCTLRFQLDLLPSGKYQVSLLTADTLAPGTALQSLRVAVKVPKYFFQLHGLANLQFGTLDFAGISRNDAPLEAPAFDYLQFRLKANDANGWLLQPGDTLPLLAFGNGGSCGGDSIFLVKNDDPFRPPNSQNAEVGQQVKRTGAVAPQSVCIAANGAAACLACAFSGEIISVNDVLAAGPVACLPAPNGMVQLFAEGAETLQYSINGGQAWAATGYFDGLPAGSYQPAVRGQYFGCEVTTTADPIELMSTTTFALQLAIPTTVCESDVLALQIMSPSPLPTGTIYEWTGPLGFTSALAAPAIFSTTPLHSGLYSFTVAAPGCDPATAAKTVTVHAQPEVPTLLAATEICTGDTLFLHSDASGSLFEWLGPAGQSAATLGLPGLATASGQTAIPPGHPAYLAGTWQVRVTDGHGCQSQSGSKEILIKNRPQAFAENDGPVCPGKPALLMANPLPGAVYRWRKMGETDVFSTQPTVVLPNVTAQQTFGLEVEMDGCPSGNISQTTVALHPKPAAFPTFGYEPADDCSPQDLQFAANASGLGLSYQWSGASGFSSQVQNPVLPQATAAANGSYQLQVTNVHGCSASSPFQVTGVVDALPTPFVQSTGAVCPGKNILLSVDGFDGLATSFTWRRNGTWVFGATADELHLDAVTAQDGGFYSVEVQVGDCEIESAQLLVEVLAAPVPAPEFLLTYPCEGSTLQFFANINGIVGWDWAGPNGFASTAASPLIYNTEFDDIGTYSLTVTGANGCTASDGVTVDGILQRPAVPEVATNSPVCPGSDLVLTVQNPVTIGTVFYDWYNGDGIPIGAGEAVLVLGPGSPLAVPPFLVRSNVNTCESELSDAIEVEILPLPVADAENTGAVCPGGEAQLFAAPVADASFEWRIAGQAAVFSFEQNPVVTLNDTTSFELTVTTAVCGAQASDLTTIFTKEKPEITGLAGGGSFCEGTAVTLNAANSTAMPGDLQYTWAGPNGFFFTATAPADGSFAVTLDEVETQAEGVYTLSLESAEGCASQPQSVLVEVVEMPAVPVLAVASTELCQGETLQLDATPYTGNFVQYDWFFNDGQADQLLGSTTFPTFFANNLSPSQSGFYFVKTNVDGCLPPPSNLVAVSVLGLPANVLAASSTTAAEPACEGEDVQLEVSFFAGASCQWSGPAGFAATVNNPLLPNVTIAGAGDYTVEISFDGCSTVLSAEASVHVSPTPEPPQLVGPAVVCEGADMAVSVANPDPAAVYFFYFTQTNALVETGNVPQFLLENVIPGQAGGYHAVAQLGGCLSANSGAFELAIQQRETASAFAGEMQVVCSEGEVVFLSGNAPTVAAAQWRPLDGAVAMQPLAPSSQVQVLRPGPNRFVWAFEHPVCGQYSADTVVVFLEEITALPDMALVPDDDNPLEINVLENDITENALAWDASLFLPAAKGQVKMDGDSTAVYTPWPNVFGGDEFAYRLCSMTCPDVCDTALVHLVLAGTASAAGCFLPNLITPNDDGENDTFIVPCAAQWPGSEITVFNRYGSRVFASPDYQNDWAGTYNGQPLPNGTYFFHLKLADGAGSVLQGYLVVNR